MGVASIGPLLENAALLLAMAVVYDIATSRRRLGRKPSRLLLAGVVLGGIGIGIMLSPFELEPGIVFDTRSVLLAVSGLFLGPIPTSVAMAITAGFRLSQGGAAAWPGVAVILASGATGIAWGRYRHGSLEDVTWRELYGLGLVVHLAMLALMFTLPWGAARQVVAGIAVPVLLVHPIATAALGTLLVNRLRRQRAALVLRESEGRYRSLFEDAHAAMLILDPEDGMIVDANPAASRFYGRRRTELQQLRIDDLEARTPDGTSAPVDGALDTERHHLVTRHRRADGSVRDVEVSRSSIAIEGRRMAYLIVQDVTERKRAEDSLRETLGQLEQAQRIAHLGSWVWRIADNRLEWSDEMLRIFGLSRPDFSGSIAEVLDRCIHPEDRAVVERAVLAASQEKALQPLECRIVRPGGAVRAVWAGPGHLTLGETGEPAILTGVVQDITERKLAEDALRQLFAEAVGSREARHGLLVEQTRTAAELHLQTSVLEAATTAIIITSRDGLIEWANPAFTTLTGYTLAEALGRDPHDLVRPEDQPGESGVGFWGALRAGQVSRRDLVSRRKDGGLYHEEQTITPVLSAAGEILHFIAFHQDVSGQKRAEEERRVVDAQLQQAQKMESVGRLAGGVAHDFNNALAVVLRRAELALRKLNPTDPLWRHLEAIREAALRSAGLTRQLLAFARKQTIAPRVLDLNQAVAGMLGMLRQLIGEDLRLTWSPGPALHAIKVDPAQVDQILANLVVNARDAIQGVGEIEVQTANTVLEPCFCAARPGCVPGAYVLLSVRDDGCGMEKDVQDRVFEPFFTTKGVGQGTGLGLATVYGIVKQSSGYIEVESDPGHGTTFKIYLPSMTDQAPDAATPADVAETRGHDETVLVVEDQTPLLDVTAEILSSLGYAVLRAKGPATALDVARTHQGPIHLLVTDVVMPMMNGRDLAARLAENRPDLRCLFVSGYTTDVIARQGVLDEGVRFLQKPFSRLDLAIKVRQALEGVDGLAPSPDYPRAAGGAGAAA